MAEKSDSFVPAWRSHCCPRSFSRMCRLHQQCSWDRPWLRVDRDVRDVVGGYSVNFSSASSSQLCHLPLPARCHDAAMLLLRPCQAGATSLPSCCHAAARMTPPLRGRCQALVIATAAPRTSYLRRAPFRPPCPMLRISDDNTRKENKGVNKNYKYLGSYR